MENISFRPASEKDAPQIAKVHVKAWQHAYKGQLPDSYLSGLSIYQRTKTWQESLKNPEPKVEVFVAEADDKVIGFVSVGPCRDKDMPHDTGELYAIYVDSGHMNEGVGSSLTEVGLNYLKELDFNKVTLWVLTSNNKTRKWYESKEWRVEGKTKTESREDFKLHEIRYIADL